MDAWLSRSRLLLLVAARTVDWEWGLQAVSERLRDRFRMTGRSIDALLDRFIP